MSRLTYKDNKVSGGYNAVDTDEYACVVKLGKLEDLEEQLGCPLDFIFKVLNSPKIYIEGMNVRGEYDDRFKFHSKPNNYILSPYAIQGKNPQVLFIDRWGYGYDLRLSDYKKTWWLKENREE